MIDFDDALKAILFHSYILPPADVSITNALGKVLAETVISPVNLPPFTKATVDGYAVFSENVKDKKAIQEVVGSITPGTFPDKKLERGQAMEILAEAPVPIGSDTIVRKENVRLLMNGSRVGMLKGVKKEEHIVFSGSLLQKGDTILEEGTLLGATEIGILIMAGKAKLKIFSPPRVEILSLGDELVGPGKRIKPGQIWDSNGISLVTLFQQMGANVKYLETVTQQAQKIKEAIMAASGANVLIITGLTGEQRRSVLLEAFKSAAVDIVFDGVTMMPGRSLIFAKRNETLIFVLPQDLFSNLLLAEVIVIPAIRKMMGFTTPYRSTFPLVLQKKIKKTPEYHVILPVTLYVEKNKMSIKPCLSKQKADIFSLVNCNALLSIPKDVKSIKKGKMVDVILIKPFSDLTWED